MLHDDGPFQLVDLKKKSISTLQHLNPSLKQSNVSAYPNLLIVKRSLVCMLFKWCYRRTAVSHRFVTHRKGKERWTQERWRKRGRPQEEKTTAAADSFHQPAAAGAGGHFPAESLSGHEHKGGDSRVDQPHRGPSQGEYSPGCKQKQLLCIISSNLRQFSGCPIYIQCFNIITLKFLRTIGIWFK